MPHRVTCLDCALPGLHVVDIRSDRHFPRHAHDQYGIGTMLEGGHRSWSGRGAVEAGRGHVITVSPDEIHDGMPIAGAPRRWRMLFVEPRVVADLAGADMARREFARPIIADADLARRVAAVLEGLPQNDAAAAEEGVADLLVALLDGPGTAPVPARPSRGVRLMLERIRDDAAAPGLAALAGVAGLTPAAAIRRFRHELGITPHAYCVQCRVRRAQRAIGAGASLTDAALSAGFADQSHMTRAFVRQIGVTPGQWRARAGSFKTGAGTAP